MSDPHTKADLSEQLSRVQQAVTETVQSMSLDQFTEGTDEAWSASSYLKHLILSVKPVAKAMNLPATKLQVMFGQPDHPSKSFAELVTVYKARLTEGFRAEDNERVIPSFYRLPDSVEDEKALLLQAWNDGNNRLLSALQNWQEEDLDRYQLPHPAVGMLTLREMLFFTLHHNTMHWQDIEQIARERSTA
jgi:hypothetical protein